MRVLLAAQAAASAYAAAAANLQGPATDRVLQKAVNTAYAEDSDSYGFSTGTKDPVPALPTFSPTVAPVAMPTADPTDAPLSAPTNAPSAAPSVTNPPDIPVEAPVSSPVSTAPVATTDAPVNTPEVTAAPVTATTAPINVPDVTLAPVATDPAPTPVPTSAGIPAETTSPIQCGPFTRPDTLGDAGSSPLIWAEEFNYNGAPNECIWSYDLGGGGWGNNELQVYTSDEENVIVEDGVLKIAVQRLQDETNTIFTSARIKTQDKFSFTYGTLEARIKPPDLDAGLWPAFWTLGKEPWPKGGEIDIFEMGQGLAIDEGLVNRRVVSAAHWDILGEYATYAKWYDSPVDLTQDFHIYKMEWTPEKIATYVDDIWIFEIDISEAACPSCQELRSPHHMMVNMAVGGGFTSGGTSSSAGGGSSSSSASSCAGSSSSAGASSSSGCGFRGVNDITAPLPAELQIDWIRLYDNGHTVVTDPSSLSEPELDNLADFNLNNVQPEVELEPQLNAEPEPGLDMAEPEVDTVRVATGPSPNLSTAIATPKTPPPTESTILHSGSVPTPLPDLESIIPGDFTGSTGGDPSGVSKATREVSGMRVVSTRNAPSSSGGKRSGFFVATFLSGLVALGLLTAGS